MCRLKRVQAGTQFTRVYTPCTHHTQARVECAVLDCTDCVHHNVKEMIQKHIGMVAPPPRPARPHASRPVHL